jgi:hypothetical protein
MKLVNRARTKSIAHFWAIERNPNCAVGFCPMVSDVTKFKTWNLSPLSWVKDC